MFLWSDPPCRAVAEESRAPRQKANQNTGVAPGKTGLLSFKDFVSRDQA